MKNNLQGLSERFGEIDVLFKELPKQRRAKK
jgi:hypothetical protein